MRILSSHPPPDGAASELDKLRAQLVDSVTAAVKDTVDTVCDEHQGSMSTSRSLSAAPSTAKDGYDLFYSHCQRLVAYVSMTMETSPDFAQQMDRIILACHDDASEDVLNCVVTKKLWIRLRQPSHSDERGSSHGASEEEVSEVVKPIQPGDKQSQRGSKRPPPVPPRQSDPNPSPQKRARHEAGPNWPKHADTDDTEDGADEDDVAPSVPPRPTRRRQIDDTSSDEEANAKECDDDAGQEVGNVVAQMQSADCRSAAQAQFFKERLRDAIPIVDAQMCKPPAGKSCSFDCASIRQQMCTNYEPCDNKLCQRWHAIEAHNNSCVNPQCELRLRIMLRETMHTIDQRKAQLSASCKELHANKKNHSDSAQGKRGSRRVSATSNIVDNEIDRLKAEVDEGEKELIEMKKSKKRYRAALSEIGITKDDDESDQLPIFRAHYHTVQGKPAAKAPSDVRGGGSVASRVRRRQGALSPPGNNAPPAPRMVTRRSAKQACPTMNGDVIVLDDDEDDDE